jgi:hypothetical protein
MLFSLLDGRGTPERNTGEKLRRARPERTPESKTGEGLARNH